MLNEREQKMNDILLKLAESLDIPPSKYELAVKRYGAVGSWLEDGEYNGGVEKPEVGPQGSFLLGTVVRPLKNGNEANYDIDLVCQLPLAKHTTSAGALKAAVGDRLKENANYSEMLDVEGRRCWTLEYAEEDGVGFHMDVLPAVLDDDVARRALFSQGVPWEYAQWAIAITEKERKSGTYSWKQGGSNPWGYAKWFADRNRPMFAKIADQQRRLLVERYGTIYSSVQAVPDALVRTPLQRVVQILKRHRDKRFLGNKWEEHKPISVIITTLAARAYQNEAEIYPALLNIVDKLDRYAMLLKPGAALTEEIADKLVERRGAVWYIPNPVNPGENFADRWNDRGSPRAAAFFQWVRWVKQDIQACLNAPDLAGLASLLVPLFGERVAKEAIPAGSTHANSARTYPTVTTSKPSKPWSKDGL